MNSMLIHIVLTKIDSDSKSTYNQKQEFKYLPSWDDCYKWLNRHCQYLETSSNGKNSKLTVKMRFDWVKQTSAYINCLRKGHTVSKSPSKSRCRICHQSHHSYLHFATVGATNYLFVQKLEPKEKD
nr:uncharacterized protein LOC118682309 [Bactrocera oleae]